MTTKAVTLARKNGTGADLLLPRTSADLVGYEKENSTATNVREALDEMNDNFQGEKPGIVKRVETLETEMDAVETAAANAQATANEANADSGVAAGNYGAPSDAAPAQGAAFTVPFLTVNSKGKVTAAANRSISMPVSTHCTHCTHCGYCSHCTYCTYCLTNCSNRGGWC